MIDKYYTGRPINKGNTKWSKEDIEDMKILNEEYNISISELGRIYGVHRSTICAYFREIGKRA